MPSGGVLSVVNSYASPYLQPTSPVQSRAITAAHAQQQAAAGFPQAQSPTLDYSALTSHDSAATMGYVQATSPQPSALTGLTVSSSLASLQSPESKSDIYSLGCHNITICSLFV